MAEIKSAGALHSEHQTRALGENEEVREVQNVALADATAKGMVSPWTKAMGKVC